MTSDETARDASHTLLRYLATHLESVKGDTALADVLSLAGDTRPIEQIRDEAGWSTYEQFRRILEASAAHLGGAEHLEGLQVDLFSGGIPSDGATVHELGDPKELLRVVANGNNFTMTFCENTGEETGPNEWVTRQRVLPGYEPFPELCSFTVGLAPLSARIYGYDEVTAVEETCELRGDDWCSVRIRWETSSEGDREVTRLSQLNRMLQGRLDALHASVAALTTADTPELVLQQIVDEAARTIRASGFVLAIHPLGDVERSVYSVGLGDHEADDLAADLLAGRANPSLSEVAEVASHRHVYGRLGLVRHGGTGVIESGVLDAYAGLAASALDAAISLWASRTEARRAQVLLELALALADITTVEGVASSLCQAMPAVVGADRALATVTDHDAQIVRVVACHGYPPDFEAALVGLEYPYGDDTATEIRYLERETADERVGPLMEATGSAGAVLVPMMLDGRVEALLIADVTDDPARLARSDELEARLLGLAALASPAVRNARLLERARRQASRDSLTDLPNRAAILERAGPLLETGLAAMFVDLDGFKEVNDTYGHAAGDALLRAVASRLQGAVREGDVLGRLGGDEFVVLVAGEPGTDVLQALGDRLLLSLAAPFLVEGRAVQISASIGVAGGRSVASAEELRRQADGALYEAKRAGKARVVLCRTLRTATGASRTADPSAARR